MDKTKKPTMVTDTSINTLPRVYTNEQKEASADATLEVVVQQEQKALKAKMKSETQVPVIIPADPMNPGITAVPVFVNGVRFDIPVGKMVKVPQSVAGILADSDYISPKLTVETFDNLQMP